MGFYRRYQKLVKCYSDGTWVVPHEFMKGDFIGLVEDEGLFGCQYTGDFGGDLVLWYSANPGSLVRVSYWIYNDDGTTTFQYKDATVDGLYRYKCYLPSNCVGFSLPDIWVTCEVNVPNLLYKRMSFISANTTIINISNATNTRYLKSLSFSGQTHLHAIIGLENLDVSNMESMVNMFKSCQNMGFSKLQSWNVSNVTDMSNMFNGCIGAASFDFHMWDVSNLQITTNMFRDCRSAATINLSGWNTINLMDAEEMFEDCLNLTQLDLSGWDTTNLTNLIHFVRNCPKLEFIDFSGWNTPNGIATVAMFEGCNALNHIRCTTAFRNWCWENQDSIYLPNRMREGGTGTWEIVD